MVQDTLDNHGFPATVKSAAVGGTSACEWAGQDNGMALVNKARSTFPDSPNGPDYVWYTLGGNDPSYDDTYKACVKGKKTLSEVEKCLEGSVGRAAKCTETMMDNYFKAFPNSRVLHSGYDLPCENALCDLTVTGSYDANWCGFNKTCTNEMFLTFHNTYLGTLNKRYKSPQYTTLNLVGASQKAAGIKGADVGKPVLTEGSPCQWTVLCVHPKYKSPSSNLIGEVFWDQYFSKQFTLGSVVV
jgi:hypothetical protein